MSAVSGDKWNLSISEVLYNKQIVITSTSEAVYTKTVTLTYAGLFLMCQFVINGLIGVLLQLSCFGQMIKFVVEHIRLRKII